MKKKHNVRIIGGIWKKSSLPIIDIKKIRPTPNRIKETLFNWLDNLKSNSWSKVLCIDAFAGTGSLGFEAASRGAKKVIMVEFDSKFAKNLDLNRQRLKANNINIICGDVFKVLQKTEIKADIIFLDPPFNKFDIEFLFIFCKKLISKCGILYLETNMTFSEIEDIVISDWKIIKFGKAGNVNFFLMMQLF